MNARYARIAVGLTCLVLSGGYLWSAFGLPMGTWARPGAAIFPIVTGAALAIASVALVLQQYRSLRTERTAETVELPGGADLKRILIFAAAIVLYVVLLSQLGYVSATFVLTLVLLRTLKLDKRGWWRVTIVSAAVASATWLLFVKVLSVHLPSGILV